MAQIPISFTELLNVSHFLPNLIFSLQDTKLQSDYQISNFCTFLYFSQLSNPPLSVPLENVKFGQCSMESEKFITVCETGQQQIAIVDMSAGNTVTRQKMNAEAAIMNPLSKVIALRCKILKIGFLIN